MRARISVLLYVPVPNVGTRLTSLDAHPVPLRTIQSVEAASLSSIVRHLASHGIKDENQRLRELSKERG